MITVEATETAFHVTIPREGVDERRLKAWVEWLEDEAAALQRQRRPLSEIAERSRMSVEEADRLANESKAHWWAENKHRFLPPDELDA
jgi:hypothetical protein